MSIDDGLGSRFAAADTAKRKRASTHGLHSDACAFELRHFKCRDKTCICSCHSTSVPRLAKREVEDA